MKRRFLVFLLILVLLLPGCAGGKAGQVFYNTGSSDSFSTDRYLAVAGFYSAEMIDKQTGERIPFPLDAGGNASCSSSFFQANGEIYYIKTRNQTDSDGSHIRSSIEELVAMDENTLEERVVHRFSWESKWFFNLLDLPPKDYGMSIVYSFFVHGGYFYFMSNDGLCRMRLLTEQYEIYLPDVKREYSYDGQNLYYTDDYNRLVIHNLDTGNSRTVEDVVASDFRYTPGGLYYLNRQAEDTLWRYDPATGETEMLSDISAMSLYFDEDSLYLQTNDGVLIRLSQSGEELARADFFGSLTVPYQGDFLYQAEELLDENGNFIMLLYQIRKSDLSATQLP